MPAEPSGHKNIFGKSACVCLCCDRMRRRLVGEHQWARSVAGELGRCDCELWPHYRPSSGSSMVILARRGLALVRTPRQHAGEEHAVDPGATSSWLRGVPDLRPRCP